ncbi:MAG TPA: hypothetical protein DEA60_07295 [Thermotoga naphthophila]|nr:hypothetical protein [Thermotoga petrophila]
MSIGKYSESNFKGFFRNFPRKSSRIQIPKLEAKSEKYSRLKFAVEKAVNRNEGSPMFRTSFFKETITVSFSLKKFNLLKIYPIITKTRIGSTFSKTVRYFFKHKKPILCSIFD